MPDIGERVKTPDGVAKVIDTNLLERSVKVRLYVDEKPKGKRGEEEEPEGEAVSRYIYLQKGRDQAHRQEKEQQKRGYLRRSRRRYHERDQGTDQGLTWKQT